MAGTDDPVTIILKPFPKDFLTPSAAGIEKRKNDLAAPAERIIIAPQPDDCSAQETIYFYPKTVEPAAVSVQVRHPALLCEKHVCRRAYQVALLLMEHILALPGTKDVYNWYNCVEVGCPAFSVDTDGVISGGPDAREIAVATELAPFVQEGSLIVIGQHAPAASLRVVGGTVMSSRDTRTLYVIKATMTDIKALGAEEARKHWRNFTDGDLLNIPVASLDIDLPENLAPLPTEFDPDGGGCHDNPLGVAFNTTMILGEVVPDFSGTRTWEDYLEIRRSVGEEPLAVLSGVKAALFGSTDDPDYPWQIALNCSGETRVMRVPERVLQMTDLFIQELFEKHPGATIHVSVFGNGCAEPHVPCGSFLQKKQNAGLRLAIALGLLTNGYAVAAAPVRPRLALVGSSAPEVSDGYGYYLDVAGISPLMTKMSIIITAPEIPLPEGTQLRWQRADMINQALMLWRYRT